MNDNNVKAAFEELLDYLELVDTRTEAILELLKDSGIVTDEKFVRYLEKADKGPSDIRIRAARARIDYLFTADEQAKPVTEVEGEAGETNRSGTNSGPTARKTSEKDAA